LVFCFNDSVWNQFYSPSGIYSFGWNFSTEGTVEEIDILLENVLTAVRRRTDNNCVSEDVFIALITIAITFVEWNTTALAVSPSAPVCAEEQSTIALKTFKLHMFVSSSTGANFEF